MPKESFASFATTPIRHLPRTPVKEKPALATPETPFALKVLHHFIQLYMAH
jgi:hypothetical protein